MSPASSQTRPRLTPPAAAGPGRGELADQLATARAVAAAARAEAVDAETRAADAEQRAADAETARDEALAERDAARASTSAAAVDAALNEVADLYVVLARWGADIDHGSPAAILEVALRDAVAHGARAARAGDGLRALGTAP